MSAVASVELSADQTKIIINYTDDREPTEITLPTVDPGELPEGASCDHEQMYTDGKYTITELAGVNGKMHNQNPKATYLVVYDCCGDGTGHSELMVNVAPIHDEKTMVQGTHVAATCDENGYTAPVCPVCRFVDEENKVYDATIAGNADQAAGYGHAWSETYLSAVEGQYLCTDGGFEVHRCTRLYHEDGSLCTAGENCKEEEHHGDGAREYLGAVEPQGHKSLNWELLNQEEILASDTYLVEPEIGGTCVYCNTYIEETLPELHVADGTTDTGVVASVYEHEVTNKKLFCTSTDGTEEFVYTVPAFRFDVDGDGELDDVAAQTITIKFNTPATQHMVGGKPLSTYYYENTHKKTDVTYNEKYEGMVDAALTDLFKEYKDFESSCKGEVTGLGYFYCDDPACGRNADGTPGDSVYVDEIGVRQPVRTYSEHDFDKTKTQNVRGEAAPNDCYTQVSTWCNVCEEYIPSSNLSNAGKHNWSWKLEVEEQANGAYLFTLSGVCTICQEETALEGGATPWIAGEEDGAFTDKTAEELGTNLTSTTDEESTCEELGTIVFTYKKGDIEATSDPVHTDRKPHVLYYTDGDKDKPVYINSLYTDTDLSSYKNYEEGRGYIDATKYGQYLNFQEGHDATCDPNALSVGQVWYTCALCEEQQPVFIYRTHNIDRSGEEGVDYTVSEGSCTAPGTATGTCLYCDAKGVSMEIPARGHDYQFAMKATGTEGQYTITITCGRAACDFSAEGTVKATVTEDEITCADKEENANATGYYVYTITEVVKQTDNAVTDALTKYDEDGKLPVTVRIANANVYHKTITGDLVLEEQEVNIVEFADKGVVESADSKASCEGYDESTGTGGTKGKGSFTCQLCTETITVVTVRTHTWDEGKVTTPVTCTTNGEITYTCSFCKGTKTEEIKAKGHTWVVDTAKTVNATWDTAGTLALECSNGDCKATTSADIPAINEATVIDSLDKAESGYTVWCEIRENCGRSGKYVVTLFAEADKGIVDENSQPVKQKDIEYSFVASKPATEKHDFVTPLYAVYREDQNLTYVGRFCDNCMQFVVEDGYIFIGKGEWDSKTNQCLGADGKPLPVYVGNFDTTELGTWDVKDQLPAYTNAIAAGETLTISGQYASTTNTTDNWYGFFVAVDTDNDNLYTEAGVDFYVRSDAWANNWASDQLYGTVTGVPADIDWAAFRTLKATAEFEVEIALDGATDTMTVTYTLFNADDTVAYEFVHTFTGMTQDSYNLTLTLDGATVTDAGVLIVRS